ncbi:Z-ring positioning protein MinC [Vibrio crassostreae]|uniref:septum site-determining protein MinC n=1 Tax=Vibrio TaxID=662 RepID=UPI0005E8CBCB|nr:septum site-determining protein MinC [Vibrio crassostreae]ROO56948.1 septum site-determining protein MinC [Vibrio crassostreae]ROO64198.1 septum site-determining protein MinC [Vibrio crassostreae]ROO67598.1 septum site-determining protein MinC [Vibrio crassostreae]ROO75246.1 septum site-determining protein MinC [Vibrio crassostreae]ROO77840.1 septum site-determining protein MinC [Vibrio crassostreae]
MSSNPDLKGSSFTLSVLHLSDDQVENAVSFLQEKVDQAPTFFAAAPVVINISKVAGDIDFVQLKNGISQAGMIPVGVAGCSDKRMQNLAKEAGFAVMTASKSPSQAPAKMAPIKVVRTPIRSGQQVYAKDGDLLILSHVSAGAEVIADGSIHIRGTLRGRAIAGASGQTEAKIICNDLQAELVSIAGNYWLSDQIESEYWQKKTMFSMANDVLHVDVLAI